MIIENGMVMPQIGISHFLLGHKYEDIIGMLGNSYSLHSDKRSGWTFIDIENAKFYFNSDKILQQIGVTVGFYGKLDNCIGIGNTLSDIQRKYGGFYNEYDQYMIKGIEGVCFELGDTDDEYE